MEIIITCVFSSEVINGVKRVFFQPSVTMCLLTEANNIIVTMALFSSLASILEPEGFV